MLGLRALELLVLQAKEDLLAKLGRGDCLGGLVLLDPQVIVNSVMVLLLKLMSKLIKKDLKIDISI